jgi:hypothetical protein
MTRAGAESEAIVDHHSPTSNYPTSHANATATRTPRTFFGEPLEAETSAVPTIKALSLLVRAVSGRLMQFSPEDWIAVQRTAAMAELAEPAGELHATVSAMQGDEGLEADTVSLPPRMEALRNIKQSAMRVALLGGRADVKLASRIFAAAPELREA